MNNLSISILNAENISSFLEKLKNVEKMLDNKKIEKLFNITIHFDVMDNEFVPNTGIDIKKIELPYQKTFDSNCEDINIVVSNLEYGLRDKLEYIKKIPTYTYKVGILFSYPIIIKLTLTLIRW